MQKLVFSLIFVFVSFNAHAALRCEDLILDSRLRSDQVTEIPARYSGPGFIVPNERYIGNYKEAFARFAEGIYLTVGTERGLMSSALAKGKIKALIQVDLDPKVVLFNRVNRALLASSKSRKDYLRLRLKSTHADWLMSISQAKELSGEDRRTLSDIQVWNWWQEKVQNFSEWISFHRDPTLNQDRAFLYANYLFDDGLYTQVADLAKRQRIFVIHDSLGKETLRQRVDGIIEALQLKLSAIDMSNAWQEGYLGHENTVRFLDSLKPQMKPETHIVFTYLDNSNFGLSNGAVFKYTFATLGYHYNLSELSLLMGNMARSEPSKSNNQRSRVNRYDDF